MFEVFGLGADFLFNAQGTDQIIQVVNRLDMLSTQIRTTGTGIEDFNATLLQFSSAMEVTGKSLMSTGLSQINSVMSGVAAAGAWQTQMVDATRYMSDTSTEAVTKYNSELASMAKLLGRTKEEINESVVSYMMMGKSTDEALRLTKNAGYAAVAWGMSAGAVSDSFRTIKAAFNVNLEDQAMYQKYLDTINEVGNATAATSVDVVNFLADGGSALHNVANVSIEQAMGMASAARYANMSIAEFSTMMTRLGNQYAQDKSTKYFTSLGVKVKEADGSMRSFSEVLYDVQKQWNNLDVATKSSFASGVGGVYADRLSLYMGSGEEYKKGYEIAQKDNTGSAENEFNRVTDTYEMAIARLQVTWDDLKVAFWQTLLPPLTSFIKIVTTVLDKISGFAQAHPVIMKFIAGFALLSGVALVVSGGFLFVSGMLTKFAMTVKMGVGPVSLLTKGLHGLRTALSASSGSIKAAIKSMGKLAVTMGALYLAWKYDLFGIRTALSDFSEKMQHTLISTKEILSDNMPVDQFNSQIKKLSQSESIWDKTSLILTRFGIVWKGVTSAWNDYELSDSMYEKLKAAGMLETVTWILLMKMKIGSFLDGVKEGFTKAITAINGFVEKPLKPPFDWVMNNILLPLSDKILGAGNALEVFFGKQNDAFGDPILERWKAFGEIVGTVLAGLLAFKSVKTVLPIFGLLGNVVKLGKIGNIFGGLGKIVGKGITKTQGSNSKLPVPLPGNDKDGPIKRNTNTSDTAFTSGFRIPNIKSVLTGMTDIALIVGGFTTLVLAYGALTQIPGFQVFATQGIQTLKMLFSNVLELSIGIGLLSLLTTTVSKVSPKQTLSGLGSIAIVLSGFTLIVSAYGLLAQIPGINEFMNSGATTLGSLFNAMKVFANPSFIALTAATAIMGKFSPSTFLSGLKDIAFVLGGFTLLISAYGALTQIPGFTDFLASGASTLAQLFGSIGEFVGSIIGGFAEGITNGLPGIGENLSEFASKVAPFFSVVGSVDTSNVSGFISALGSFMLMMSAESVLNFISGGTNLSQLGKDLSAFGVTALGFFAMVSAYPEAGLKKAPQVFESISNLGGYATKSGGLAQLATGTTDLPKLGKDLSAFSLSAVLFFMNVSTFPQAGIDKAPKVFDAITSLGGYATKSGGLAQLITGTTDLPKLGKGLSEFSTSVTGFFMTVGTFSDSSLTKGKLVFEVLANIGDYGLRSGGLAQLFTGTTDLSKIGKQLSDFGVSIQGYFSISGALSESAIAKGQRIFEVLSAIGDYAFRSGGIAQVFSGGVDLTSIGTQLSTFGSAVRGYFIGAALIPDEGLSKGRQVFSALSGIGDFVQASLSMSNLGVAGTQLTNFITNAETFFTKATSIDTSGMMALIGPLTNFFNVFENANVGNMSSTSSNLIAIGNSVEYLANKIPKLSADMVSELGNNIDMVKNFCDDGNNTVAGTNIPKSVADGVTQNGGLVKTAMTNVFTSAATVLPGKSAGPLNSSSLYDSGRKIMSTMASGINANSSVIKNAMTSAFNKAKAVLPHSDADEGPFSTLTASGASIPGTMAQGVISNAGSLYKAMYSAGQTAQSAFPKSADMNMNFTTSGLDGFNFPKSANMNFVADRIDGSLDNKVSIIITSLNSITNLLSNTGLKNVTFPDNSVKNNEVVRNIQADVAEQKASGTQLILQISPGAFTIAPQFNGNSVSDDHISEVIKEMIESDIFPKIMDEFNRLAELKNTKR